MSCLVALATLAVGACKIPSTNEAPLAARQVAAVPRAPTSGTQVWANAASGVYHCPNSPNYGNTQDGEYMSERAALSKGYRPSHDRGCSDARDGVKVWVNTTSGVYHCPSTQWYGATDSGEYMPEKEARAKGFTPAKGEGCVRS